MPASARNTKWSTMVGARRTLIVSAVVHKMRRLDGALSFPVSSNIFRFVHPSVWNSIIRIFAPLTLKTLIFKIPYFNSKGHLPKSTGMPFQMQITGLWLWYSVCAQHRCSGFRKHGKIRVKTRLELRFRVRCTGVKTAADLRVSQNTYIYWLQCRST